MNYHEQLVKEKFNKNNSQHQHEKNYGLYQDG